MTDVDEQVFTAAKLAEQVRGDLDTTLDLHRHAGVVADTDHAAALSFLEGVDGWSRSSLRSEVEPTLNTAEATRAVMDGRREQLATIVGLTEAELTASQMRLLSQLSAELDNHGAPAFVSVGGNPETGKTNAGWLLIELRKQLVDDLLVFSNAAGSLTDIRVTSMHELTELLIEHRERPKAVLLDECSTHMDARTHSREVATQWTPVAKRMAKLGVDVQLNVVHSGKDYHPEGKRLTTLGVWKSEKTVAEFFSNWSADADRPSNPIFSGPVGELELTSVEYDPDDTAPWSWDLEQGLFEADRDWKGYLDQLRDL